MAYQLTPTVPVHAVIFCTTLALGIYAALQYRRYKIQPELPPFVIFMIGISSGQVVSIIISVNTSPQVVLWMYNVSNAVVIPIIIYSFLLFTLNFSGYTQLPERYIVGVAVAESGVLLTAVLLDPDMLYEITSFTTVGPTSFLNVTVSEWAMPIREFHSAFLVLEILYSLIVVVGMAIVVRYVIFSAEMEPVQSVVVILALLSPIGTNLLLVFDVFPRVTDPLMLSFGLTAVGFAVATFRYRTFDIAPTGRQQVITDMDDAVVLLNSEGVVADMNPAAEALFSVDDSWRGVPAEQIFGEDIRQLTEQSSGETLRTRVSRSMGGRIRHFDLRISSIKGATAGRQATLVVFRDVTSLIEREQELDLLTQIFSRVLRHNIRNDMSAIMGYADVLAQQADDGNAEMARKIMDTSNSLVELSDKARSVEELVQTDQSPTTIDLVASIEDIVATHQTEFPGVTFRQNLQEECVVTAIPAINQMITNLVENAAEHNTHDEPEVVVELTTEAETAVLSISDNGPGIPHNELLVIEEREEKALQHGSGVGLWIVDWVNRNSTAAVEFDIDGTGTEATVIFHEKGLNRG